MVAPFRLNGMAIKKKKKNVFFFFFFGGGGVIFLITILQVSIFASMIFLKIFCNFICCNPSRCNSASRQQNSQKFWANNAMLMSSEIWKILNQGDMAFFNDWSHHFQTVVVL